MWVASLQPVLLVVSAPCMPSKHLVNSSSALTQGSGQGTPSRRPFRWMCSQSVIRSFPVEPPRDPPRCFWACGGNHSDLEHRLLKNKDPWGAEALPRKHRVFPVNAILTSTENWSADPIILWVVYSPQIPNGWLTPFGHSKVSVSTPLTKNYLANSWGVQVDLLTIPRFYSVTWRH